MKCNGIKKHWGCKNVDPQPRLKSCFQPRGIPRHSPASGENRPWQLHRPWVSPDFLGGTMQGKWQGDGWLADGWMNHTYPPVNGKRLHNYAKITIFDG